MPKRNSSKFIPEHYHKYYVYVLCKPNGEVFYVGKGKGNRINDHFSNSNMKGNSRKIATIKKYGDSVKREILCYFDKESDAFDYEEWLISHYKTVCDGGTLTNYAKTRYEYCKDFSRKLSETLRKKFSKEIVLDFYKDFFENCMERKSLKIKYGMSSNDVSKISRGIKYILLYEEYVLGGKIKDNRVEKIVPEKPVPKEPNLSHNKILEIYKKYSTGNFNLDDLAQQYNTSAKYLSAIFSGKKRGGRYKVGKQTAFKKRALSLAIAKSVYLDRQQGMSYSGIMSKYSLPKTTVARICNKQGQYSILQNLENA